MRPEQLVALVKTLEWAVLVVTIMWLTWDAL